MGVYGSAKLMKTKHNGQCIAHAVNVEGARISVKEILLPEYE